MRYRPSPYKTLMMFSALYLILPLGCLAQTSDDGWPEPVYFPQRSEQTKATQTQEENSQPNPTVKKRLWPFRQKQQSSTKPNKTTPSPKQSVTQDPPSSPYPLLRLPRSIVTEQGIISPGIYSIQPNHASLSPKANQPAKLEAVTLSQRNKTLLTLPVHPEQTPSTPTSPSNESPIEKRDAKKPNPYQAAITISEDQKRLKVRYFDGITWFESAPLAIMDDTRRLLNY